VFTGFLDTTNPWDSPTNGDIGDRTHWQKGLVNYTHGAQNDDVFTRAYSAKGIPIDAALGAVDTLDLNNSWEGSVPLWYKLLNCGFRIHATAGTDCFLNRIDSRLPGSERVYVKTGAKLDYGEWIDGLRAGRSFVTSGPMIEFAVNGQLSGSTLRLGDKGKVRVKASVRSQFPFAAAEVVHNGKVVATAELAADRLSAAIDEDIPLGEGGWLAFRARGPGTPDTLSPTQNAHANPVYIEIAGKTYRSADDARDFLIWLDRLELLARTRDRFPTPKHRQQVLEQFEAARKVYGGIIREAK
jgi:hypothetical protein